MYLCTLTYWFTDGIIGGKIVRINDPAQEEIFKANPNGRVKSEDKDKIVVEGRGPDRNWALHQAQDALPDLHHLHQKRVKQ